MSITTIVYLILAAFLSLLIAFFQYFFKEKMQKTRKIVLFTLKTFSLFLLFLLLINPKIKVKTTENIKPVLAVLKDKSASIPFFKVDESIEKSINLISSNSKINDKFTVKNYSFSDRLFQNDSIKTTNYKTNISKAIKTVNELYKDNIGAIVIATDGNETIGNNYEFINSKKKVYPIVFGDTTQYQDIKIAQLNVNKYNYIKNKFPVEAFIQYDGKKKVNTEYSIYFKGKKIYSERVELSANKPTKTITTNLTSNTKGIQFYTAKVTAINDEKNIKNNAKNFSVEVIDEQQKGLIIASINHPDLGAFKKAIESDKKRTVKIITNLNEQINYNDYQFFILYQPNYYFKKFFDKIKSNFLVVTGTKTDWSILNQELSFSRRIVNRSEDFVADFNKDYITFQQEDIGFNQFPPLQERFGKLEIRGNYQTLLYQKLQRFENREPLLATFENNDIKYAALFGEGIWKWRAETYRNKESFADFDNFIGNLLQYIASTKKRDRLEITVKRIYQANETIKISALYLDKNFVFDDRASLWLTLTNLTTKETKRLPMSLKGNSYEINVEDVAQGNYSYKVSVDNQSINKRGNFKVEVYNVEQQFTNANVSKLQKLATNTKGKLYYPKQEEDLINQLIKSEEYYTTQKSIEEEKNLIDWKWILLLIAFLLSLEWFIRKYYGKI